jgi:signal transduction histidine kinase
VDQPSVVRVSSIDLAAFVCFDFEVQEMSQSHAVQPRKLARSSSGTTDSELSRHLLRAQEEERKRISRELHDGTGQGLMVLRLYLGMLASESQSLESELKIQEALKLLDHTIEELRRIIGRLSPRTLDELGLLAAARREARGLSRSTGLTARLDLPKELVLEHEVEVALYRSLQEALHNIAKHAQARNFVIRIESSRGLVRLTVEDDGVGFSGKSNSRGRSFGLLGMRERIAALGGRVRLHSRKGMGTRLSIALPVQARSAGRPRSAGKPEHSASFDEPVRTEVDSSREQAPRPS